MFSELTKVWKVQICMYHDAGKMVQSSRWVQWLHYKKIMCVDAQVCGCVCTYTRTRHKERLRQTQVSVFRSSACLHTLLETESFNDLKFLPRGLYLLACIGIPGIHLSLTPISPCQHQEYRSTPLYLASFMGSGDLNPDSHICKTNW